MMVAIYKAEAGIFLMVSGNPRLSQKIVPAGLDADTVGGVTCWPLCKCRTHNRFGKLSVHTRLRWARTDKTVNVVANYGDGAANEM